MKVKCIAISGKDLSPKTLSEVGFSSTEFQLEIDALYTVYGIVLKNGVISYLTMDRWKTLPFWLPAELFLVEDHLLPLDWYYRHFYPPIEGKEALWGYEELVLDPNHYLKLIERDNEAVKIFLKRKEEIDHWS